MDVFWKICTQANLRVLEWGEPDWPVCQGSVWPLKPLKQNVHRSSFGAEADTHTMHWLRSFGVVWWGEGGVTSKMSTWLAFLCLSSNKLPPLHRHDSSLWDDSDDTESLKLWVKVQRMPGFKLEFFLFQISEDYFDHWSGGWIPLPLICPGQRHAPTECWHDNKM